MSLDRLYDAKVRMTVDYLFGRGVSRGLPKQLRFEISKKTKRIRHIYHRDKLLATTRPDGTLALTINGAKYLARSPTFRQNCVVVNDDVKDIIKEGRSVFAKHVVSAGEAIRPASEVAVLDSKDNVIAVGRAILPAVLMTAMKRGVAVKVRRGHDE